MVLQYWLGLGKCMSYNNLIRIIYPDAYGGIARELTTFQSGIADHDIVDVEWVLREEHLIITRILEIKDRWIDMTIT